MIVNGKCNSIEELSHDPALLDSPVNRTFSRIRADLLQTRTDDLPANVDVAIIGAGIIGCGLACQLWHSHTMKGLSVAILDAHKTLLQNFSGAVNHVKQKVMRSPYEHQLAPDGDLQLIDYARLHYDQLTDLEREQVWLGLSGQSSIVPLDLFISHSLHTVSTHRLDKVTYRFRVDSIAKSGNSYWLQDAKGRRIHARYVIVATGMTQLGWNFQVSNNRSDHMKNRIHSAYEAFPIIEGEKVAVVGSGLTAGHILLSLVNSNVNPVWILRGEERYQCADVDTAYFRTEGIAHFRKLSAENRALILRSENRGSLMLEFLPIMRKLEEQKRISVKRNAALMSIDPTQDSLSLQLTSGDHCYGVHSQCGDSSRWRLL